MGLGDLLGSNSHLIPDPEDPLLRDVAQEKIEPCREGVARLREHRSRRGGARTEELHASGRDPSANPMPAIVAATEEGATMGEMAGVLRMAYGRAADPFRALDDPVRVK